MSYHELRDQELASLQLATVSEADKQSMQIIVRVCEVGHSSAELRYLAEEFEAAAWRKLQEERKPKIPYTSHPRATNPPKFES